MACPHVAGVAALVWSHEPNFTAQQIRAILESTAQDLGPVVGKDNEYGWGLVRADFAYALFPPTVSPAPTDIASPTPSAMPSMSPVPTRTCTIAFSLDLLTD